MNFDLIHQLLSIIEKAAGHGSKFNNIIAIAHQTLADINASAAKPAETYDPANDPSKPKAIPAESLGARRL